MLSRRKLLNWIRNCAWQRYFCSYFPIKLIKTVDLDPSKLYLFCNFPHGILSSGIYGAFGTDAAGCKELFPGIEFKVVILDQHLKAPFFREYCRINCTYHGNFLSDYWICCNYFVQLDREWYFAYKRDCIFKLIAILRTSMEKGEWWNYISSN